MNKRELIDYFAARINRNVSGYEVVRKRGGFRVQSVKTTWQGERGETWLVLCEEKKDAVSSRCVEIAKAKTRFGETPKKWTPTSWDVYGDEFKVIAIA